MATCLFALPIDSMTRALQVQYNPLVVVVVVVVFFDLLLLLHGHPIFRYEYCSLDLQKEPNRYFYSEIPPTPSSILRSQPQLAL
jgi:hypothetical protein